MANKACFASLVLEPTRIDGPGQYLTRCGEQVVVAHASSRHDFGCSGTYSDGTLEHWHKSGRIFFSQESPNDIIDKDASLGHQLNARDSVGVPR